jgi:hypothetical protein
MPSYIVTVTETKELKYAIDAKTVTEARERVGQGEGDLVKDTGVWREVGDVGLERRSGRP